MSVKLISLILVVACAATAFGAPNNVTSSSHPAASHPAKARSERPAPATGPIVPVPAAPIPAKTGSGAVPARGPPAPSRPARSVHNVTSSVVAKQQDDDIEDGSEVEPTRPRNPLFRPLAHFQPSPIGSAEKQSGESSTSAEHGSSAVGAKSPTTVGAAHPGSVAAANRTAAAVPASTAHQFLAADF